MSLFLTRLVISSLKLIHKPVKTPKITLEDFKVDFTLNTEYVVDDPVQYTWPESREYQALYKFHEIKDH